jgi:hypothetical protein
MVDTKSTQLLFDGDSFTGKTFSPFAQEQSTKNNIIPNIIHAFLVNFMKQIISQLHSKVFCYHSMGYH